MKFIFLITAILIILKLNGVIVWSWDDVFLPGQLLILAGVFFALLYILMDRLHRNQNDEKRSKDSD